MLFRIWTVSLKPGMANALETFARANSLPMFQRQEGCLAVFFTRTELECVTVTIWSSPESIRVMEVSADYQQVVSAIENSGILGSDHETKVLDVYGGFVAPSLPSLVKAREF